MMRSNEQKTEVTQDPLADEQLKNIRRQRRPAESSGGFDDDVHDEVAPRELTAPEERQ